MDAPKRRFYGVQILRGLAATLVLFHHQIMVASERIPGSPFPQWLQNGAFGVDLFFPISGFVMYLTARSLQRKLATAAAWRDFAWRRVVRVVPLYWLATVLKILIFLAMPAVLLHYTFLKWNVVGSFFFIPVFDHNIQPEPVVPVGWTLNSEMFFYALVACALATRANLVRFLAVTIGLLSLAGLLYQPPLYSQWQSFLFWIHPIALEFVAGILLGVFLDRVTTRSALLATAVFAVATSFALVLPVGDHFTFSLWRPLLWGLPGAAVLWATLSLEKSFRWERRRFLLLLGDASYSLYLVQTFLMPAFGVVAQRFHLAGTLGLAFFFCVGTPCTIGISILVHLYVELPILRVLSSVRPPWSARSVEATS